MPITVTKLVTVLRFRQWRKKYGGQFPRDVEWKLYQSAYRAALESIEAEAAQARRAAVSKVLEPSRN